MMLSPNFDNIPAELKRFPQWVNWRTVPRKEGGKPTKPPFQPDGRFAEPDNPKTWSSFSVVKDAAPRFDGVGFMFTNDDDFVGIDFDACYCPAFNLVRDDVAEHLKKFDSYTEISPSGRGCKSIVRGHLPVDGRKKGNYEIYQNGRYFALTGHVRNGFSRTIESRQKELDAFYTEVFGTPTKPLESEKISRLDSPPGNWKERLEKAFQSKKGEAIKRLWEGDFSAYSSQSEGDMAFCSYLAFWLDGDSVVIDAVFRESRLYRKKWDEKHGIRTYGEATIEKAIAGCKSFYGDLLSQEGEPANLPQSGDWPEPVPFDDYSSLPLFPVETLPGVCGAMVQAITDSLQVDPGLPGTIMLAALSTAIGARINIRLDSHTEQGNGYYLAVLASGNMKSANDRLITAPLYSYQKAKQDAMKAVIRKAQSNMKVLEKRLEKFQKAAAEKDDPHERNLLQGDIDAVLREIEENHVPTKPIYLVDDVTLERLGEIMADNDERCAVLSPEGGFFKIIAGLYSRGHVANLDLVLKAHAGDPWGSERIGREAKSMSNPALTIGLSVQPDVIEEIGQNSEFRGRGLSARNLYSWCRSKAGFRTLQSSPVPENVKDAYHKLIVSLMEVEGRHELKLASDAQAIWNDFYAEVEKRLRPGSELEHLVDWGSKLPGAVARVAGHLHFAEHGPDGIGKPILSGSVINACLLGAYYIEHAKAVFGIMKTDTRIAVARKILSYIKRCRPERFKGRDLFDHTTCASMDEIQPGLNILIERGHIREVGRPDEKRAGRPASQAYDVNPKIFSKV